MNWQEISGNWVLIPPRPIAIIHFLGGAFVATAPQLTYRSLLEFLAAENYAIVATPFVNTFDHSGIAVDVHKTFERTIDFVHRQAGRRYLPIYGMGHSMGCKVHLLIGSMYPIERSGNIFMSFNNYPARRSIPFIEQFYQFAPNFAAEFTPSPEETIDLIEKKYSVERNLLIKFRNDDIDQTRPLNDVLIDRFPKMTTTCLLKGNHLTPLGQDVNWKSGQDFTPFDAIGQLFRQEVLRDFNELKKTILLWLNPLRVRE
ncbi:DUF1350 family protein [Microcoleus sp. FACHB-1515]|uniref:DUF1350 family protein n=1 Tax=Cyanophyceae TaxID=3028117 RepID=UPI001683583E|nr:DUF1350 family protein [Microcoleus sp. FACHB-1515]MBD2090033.1 DUF1350 family protein [Microcoleus sp. FACHB-1515]